MVFWNFKRVTVSRHSGDTGVPQGKVAGSQCMCMSRRTKCLLSLCIGPVTHWHIVHGVPLSSASFIVLTGEEANQPCLC